MTERSVFADLNPPYATIVADPPWDYPEGFALGPGHGVLEVRPLPYSPMSLSDIAALPVRDLAAKDARLFLWTTSRYLPDAFDVLDAWGFDYRQALVWHKRDANLPGSVAPNSAEFALVAARGAPRRLATMPSAVIATTRRGGHSHKPEAFLDHGVSVRPSVPLRGRRSLCGGCGRMFTGVSAFDLHQTGTGPVVCHDPRSVGLILGGDGVWGWPGTWRGPNGADRKTPEPNRAGVAT